MNDIRDMIRSLENIQTANGEVLYSVLDLKMKLNELRDGDITAEECILTPYYVHEGRRLELYEYELNIHVTDHDEFANYILTRTGKRNIEDVAADILRLNQECYISVPGGDCKLPVKRMERYIEFLCGAENLILQVRHVFGKFESKELWFAFY